MTSLFPQTNEAQMSFHVPQMLLISFIHVPQSTHLVNGKQAPRSLITALARTCSAALNELQSAISQRAFTHVIHQLKRLDDHAQMRYWPHGDRDAGLDLHTHTNTTRT